MLYLGEPFNPHFYLIQQLIPYSTPFPKQTQEQFPILFIYF